MERGAIQMSAAASPSMRSTPVPVAREIQDRARKYYATKEVVSQHIIVGGQLTVGVDPDDPEGLWEVSWKPDKLDLSVPGGHPDGAISPKLASAIFMSIGGASNSIDHGGEERLQRALELESQIIHNALT
jgi:hypothetical protein